jgi:hypothetical protein
MGDMSVSDLARRYKDHGSNPLRNSFPLIQKNKNTVYVYEKIPVYVSPERALKFREDENNQKLTRWGFK